jgi:CBS domain-containing protein
MKTAEDIVKEKNKDIVSISCDQTIYQAVRIMIENKIGAILVTKNDEYVGIRSEKDLLRHITDPGFDPQISKIGDFMSSPVRSVPHDAAIY